LNSAILKVKSEASKINVFFAFVFLLKIFLKPMFVKGGVLAGYELPTVPETGKNLCAPYYSVAILFPLQENWSELQCTAPHSNELCTIDKSRFPRLGFNKYKFQ